MDQNLLWADLKTNEERLAYLKSGDAYKHGIISKAIEQDLISAYTKLLIADASGLNELLGKLYAILKETGEKKKVKIINVDQKQVYLQDDKWGTWHNYSKRGDVILFVV